MKLGHYTGLILAHLRGAGIDIDEHRGALRDAIAYANFEETEQLDTLERDAIRLLVEAIRELKDSFEDKPGSAFLDEMPGQTRRLVDHSLDRVTPDGLASFLAELARCYALRKQEQELPTN